jgi:alkylation response protein AidB-like acyl-CoA dehydrogenase
MHERLRMHQSLINFQFSIAEGVKFCSFLFCRISVPESGGRMDFSYSDELTEIKRAAREFAEKEIRPHVMEWDEAQKFPRDTLAELGKLGFLGVLIPPEFGGAGLGYLEYVTIIEELSRVDGSIGISAAAHNSLCVGHIFTFGTEEQRRRYVTPLAKGEKLGAWSLTEPGAGSDAAGTRTTARLEGDHWVLNGHRHRNFRLNLPRRCWRSASQY